MPKTAWEVRTHALSLLVAFGLPLFLEVRPDYAALGAASILALVHVISTVKSDDPFLSEARVTCLAGLLLLNAAAYSLSAVPSLPTRIGPMAICFALAYLAVMLLVVVRAARRVAAIDLEYFQYSLPSKRLTVDMGRRTGRLDPAQASLRLQLFVKEGLQFRRLSRVCRLLVMQGWAGLAVFVLFGFQEPWNLLIFLANSLVVSTSATSIASRATLHPGMPLDLGPEPAAEEDWDDDEDEEDYEQYLTRRRHR